MRTLPAGCHGPPWIDAHVRAASCTLPRRRRPDRRHERSGHGMASLRPWISSVEFPAACAAAARNRHLPAADIPFESGRRPAQNHICFEA